MALSVVGVVRLAGGRGSAVVVSGAGEGRWKGDAVELSARGGERAGGEETDVASLEIDGAGE